jgi:hypothetical protein
MRKNKERLADHYTIKYRKRKDSVTLTREDWLEILIHLGPHDDTQLLYDKVNEQTGIFIPEDE